MPVFGIDHEQISQHLIVNELGGAARRAAAQPDGAVRRGRGGRPVARRLPGARRGGRGGGGRRRRRRGAAAAERRRPIPRWVRLLHRALSGAVTVDNLDYVRRDACMCGVGLGPVDVDRLIYYTFCTADGLTFHKRALSALRAFLNARFYMYENVYFHRIGHAIDLHLHEIFRPTHGARSCRRARSTTRRPTGGSPSGRCSPPSRPGSTSRWRSERRELAEEWQSHHPPPREVQHGVRAPRGAAAAAAGGARPHARGVPRRHRAAPAAGAARTSSSSSTSPRRTRGRSTRCVGPKRHRRLRPRHRRASRSSCSAASSSSCRPRRTCTGCSRWAASTSASSPSRPRRRWARSSRRASRTSEAAGAAPTPAVSLRRAGPRARPPRSSPAAPRPGDDQRVQEAGAGSRPVGERAGRARPAARRVRRAASLALTRPAGASCPRGAPRRRTARP